MDHSHPNARTGTMRTESPMVIPTQYRWGIQKARGSSQPDAPRRESSMNFDSVEEIIATRRLYFFDEGNNKRTVSVFIGKPQQSPDSTGYRCPIQVIGIGSQLAQSARGVDSIRALQSALILLAESLNHLNNQIGGKLAWEDGCQGEGELGFP